MDTVFLHCQVTAKQQGGYRKTSTCLQKSSNCGFFVGESGLNWTDLLPEEEDVQAFISQQKLQFIQADASSSEATLSARIWSPENGEAEMEPMRNGAGHTSETESSDSTQKPEGLPAISAEVLDKKPETELDQTAEEETTIQEKLDESEPVVLVARKTRQRAPSNLRKKTSGLTQTEPVVFVGAAFCKEWPKICVSFGFSEDEYSSILKEQQQQPLTSKHLGPPEVVLEVVPKVLQGFWLPPEDTCLKMPSQHLSVLAVSLTKAVEDMISKLLPSLLREVSFTHSTRDKLVQSIQDNVSQSFTHPVLMEKISCCVVDLMKSMTTIATKNICELFQPQISTKEPNTVAEEVKQEPHQESAFTLPPPAPPVTPPAEPAVVLEGEGLSHVPIIPPAPVTPPAVTSTEQKNVDLKAKTQKFKKSKKSRLSPSLHSLVNKKSLLLFSY